MSMTANNGTVTFPIMCCFPSRCLTLRITRPPTRWRLTTSLVSRVACMRLLGGVQLPPELARGAIRLPSFAPLEALRLLRCRRLTPRITRRPTSWPKMTSRVSAVACMRLLGGVQVPPKPACGVIRHPLFALTDALRPFVIPPPNAAHHAPAHQKAFDDIPRVAGRVHALVRWRHL